MTWRDAVAKTSAPTTPSGGGRFDVWNCLNFNILMMFCSYFCFWWGGFGLGWVGWRPLLFFSNGQLQVLCVDGVQGLI